MESTEQYWKPVWEALERYWKTLRQKREGKRRNVALGAGAIESRAAGTQEGFPRCRTPREAVGRPGTDSQLYARCRAATVADRDAAKVPVDTPSRAAAEPSGVFARRGPCQVVEPSLGFAGRQCPAHLKALAEGETNPAALAALADRNLRATPEQLCDALGACTDIKPVYRRLLQMLLEQLQARAANRPTGLRAG